MLRTLLEKIELSLGPDEKRYRLSVLPADITQAAAGVLVTLGLTAVVFALELAYFEQAQLSEILGVRLSFFAFSGIIVFTNRRPTDPTRLDNATLLWTLGLAAQFIVLTALRPPSSVDGVAMVMMVLGFYAIAPTPIAKRTAPAIFLSAGYVLVLTFVRDTPTKMVWPTAAVLLAMNVLGIWVSARLQTQRRQQFQSQEKLRASLLERDALIDKLRQSHKMESVGRIAGGVAHDFNNLLGTMLASVEFLLHGLPSESDYRADAETIRTAVHRGAELTRQLLAFSRQQVLEPKVVNLNELVSDTQRLLMRTIGADVAIDVSLAEQLASVRVDPGQVQQILLNLSVNARDAMPHGGTLSIQTANLTLTGLTPMSHSVAGAGSYVMLSVADDGTGMDFATMSQIFEPFFTTKPKGRGTGLGLSTVFGIIEQSGGHIRVASTQGEGTMFEIFLPTVAGLPEPVQAQRRGATPRGHETILLAEDDDELRSLTARVLVELGYHVLQASDGLEAIRVASNHHKKVDLLATDIVMPSMGGPDLARELSRRQPGLKVLFMSGYIGDDARSGELAWGDAFMQKPVDPKMLGHKVRQLLDGNAVAL